MSKFLFPAIIFFLAGFFIYRTWTTHKAAESNFAEGQAFLLENGKKEGVITTESGLQYQVLQSGSGEVHPALGDKVKVHYHGTLIDGTVFDSSVERGEPISFGLKQVIKGWQEGLQYMVTGEKVRLFVPSTLGYGKSGSGPIPPASVLIFDVELLDIN
ncbi:peptidylprolyl isomerase [Vibrio azureus]|uniref:Peptidyl-prolyl cis-trans isomerase n=1 Tax=Vibrio azureus NBRC 104587 TaxID=1219077 RepID=U3AWY1_9VIBR|nr:FKBP-type peptidyl-prolyl cis-trans isomerase [Vibrio azureus]AUI88348.1 peptidylprolyl isomerase [Vibrio azureus]GAD77727.1 FKBP-type peptidyl-prolyl cis-trans isomerase FklB [Vibrio azureus NBRC 104587]